MSETLPAQTEIASSITFIEAKPAARARISRSLSAASASAGRRGSKGMGGVAEGGEPQPDRLDIRRGVRCPLHREAPLGEVEPRQRHARHFRQAALVGRQAGGAAHALDGEFRPRRPAWLRVTKAS